MGSTFFNEIHFSGLIERVREKGKLNISQRVADQVYRLFSPSTGNQTESGVAEPFTGTCEDIAEEYTTGSLQLNEHLSKLESQLSAQCQVGNRQDLLVKHKRSSDTDMKIATRESIRLKDSKSCDDIKSKEQQKTHEDIASSNMCARLCSLIKTQLVKAHEEVVRRFGGQSLNTSQLDANTPEEENKGTSSQTLENKEGATAPHPDQTPEKVTQPEIPVAPLCKEESIGNLTDIDEPSNPGEGKFV